MIWFLLTHFLLWRILLFFLAWIGGVFFPFSPRFPYAEIYLIPSHLPYWFWTFGNFDGVHYLTLATGGYIFQFTQVFFPLYPLLIRLLHSVSPLLSGVFWGVFISSLFFFLSLFVFSQLILFDRQIPTVRWPVLFLLFFPTSYYFGSVYTESVFLFFTLCAFLAARKNRWWYAGFFGALASATRLLGIFLLPALLWEWVFGSEQKSVLIHSGRKAFRSLFRFPPLYLVPTGLLSYMTFLQFRFGDWLLFWHVQPAFGAERAGSHIILPPQVLYRYIRMFFSLVPFSEPYAVAFLEFSSTLLAAFLLVRAHRLSLRPSYLIFSWFAFFVPTLTGTLSSMPRYILVLFPIYLSLGMIQSNRKKIVMLFFSITFLCLLTILFTRGHWVG